MIDNILDTLEDAKFTLTNAAKTAGDFLLDTYIWTVSFGLAMLGFSLWL